MEHNVFWAPVMRAAALAHLGRHSEAQTSLEHLLLVCPDFRESGPRLIRKGIKMEDLARRVEEALQMVGMDFSGQGH